MFINNDFNRTLRVKMSLPFSKRRIIDIDKYLHVSTKELWIKQGI